jgi:hypothetical protein
MISMRLAVGLAGIISAGGSVLVGADLSDLLSRLNDSRLEVKQAAYLEATRLGLDARSSPYYQQLLRALKEGMRDERPTIRNLACSAVGSIRPEPGDILRERRRGMRPATRPA